MTKNQIEYQRNVETKRSNLAVETETARANREREKENFRSNTAREAETLRSNLAKEGENYRSNTAREDETRRNNMVHAAIGWGNLGESKRTNLANELLKGQQIMSQENIATARNVNALDVVESQNAGKLAQQEQKFGFDKDLQNMSLHNQNVQNALNRQHTSQENALNRQTQEKNAQTAASATKYSANVRAVSGLAQQILRNLDNQKSTVTVIQGGKKDGKR